MQPYRYMKNSFAKICVDLGNIEFHEVDAGTAGVVLQGGYVSVRFFEQRLLKAQHSKTHHAKNAVKKYRQRFLRDRETSVNVDNATKNCHMYGQKETPLNINAGGDGLRYIDQFIKRHC